MRLSQFEGRSVIDARGRAVGKVTRALFDPELPSLVGFEVRMNPLLYTVERPRRYIARTGVSLSKAGLRIEKPARLERLDSMRSRIDWDETVVWTGMPIMTESGKEPLGFLKDADLGGGGRVKQIMLTRGATSDAAIGTREIDGGQVLGFAAGAIRVVDSVGGVEFSGGVAAGAGRGAAVAKVHAEKAAVGAAKTAVAAARAAKRSGVGKRASASWKGFAEGMREGLAGDEPDKPKGISGKGSK